MNDNNRDDLMGALNIFISKALLIIPFALSVFGLSLLVFLLLDMFGDPLMWIFATVTSVIASLFIFKKIQNDITHSNTEMFISLISILVLVLCWGIFNSFYNSQHVFTNRDPATYAISGVWLTKNDNLKIENLTDYYDAENNIVSSSAGFANAKNDIGAIHAQGQHLLPVYLGASGRITNESLLLKTNVVFGMTAILSFFIFAIRLVRPYWAFVASAVFSISMPLIYFSKDTFTEPLSVTFLFGGLALLLVTQKQHKHRLITSFASGIVIGTGVAVRVDGFFNWLIPTGIIIGLLYFGIKSKKRSQIKHFYPVMLLAIGMSIPTLIGWLDLTLLSSHYYNDIKPRLFTQIYLVLGLLILTTIFYLSTVLSGINKILGAIISKHSRLIAYSVGAGFAALYTFFLSRPLWTTSYINFNTRNSEGDLVPKAEAARDFAELTAYWPIWYLGPLALVGVFGVSFFLYKYLNGRIEFVKDYKVLFAFTFMLIIVMGVYFIKPSIYPDQIWAARRQLTVILPGLVLFGAIGLEAIYNLLRRSLSDVARAILVILVTFALIIPPFFISQPILTLRERARLSAVLAICNSIPKDSAVMWAGSSSLWLPMPTRSYCEVDSIAHRSKAGLTSSAVESFYETTEKKGLNPVIGMFTSDFQNLDIAVYQPINTNTKIIDANFRELEHVNVKPAREIKDVEQKIILFSKEVFR